MDSTDQPFFLFIGNSDAQAATTQLRATGVFYRKKLLGSSAGNWQQIVELMESPQVKGVVATLRGEDYETLLKPEYQEVAPKLLAGIAKIPNIVFVHEQVFFSSEELTEFSDSEEEEGTDDSVSIRKFMRPSKPIGSPFDIDGTGLASEDLSLDVDFEQTYFEENFFESIDRGFFPEVDHDTRSRVNDLLASHNVSVMVYRTNLERAVIATNFVKDHERNLLFRVYLPNDRIYAEEAEEFIESFRDWMRRTNRVKLRREGYSTASGQVIEFFAEEQVPEEELQGYLQDFSRFLNLCAVNPVEASGVLVSAGFSQTNASIIAKNYGKKARRIDLDIRQRREERILLLKHEMENFQLESVGASDAEIGNLIELMIPEVRGRADVLAIDGSNGAVSLSGSSGSVPGGFTVNNQNVIYQIERQVVQNIQATVDYGGEAKEILELVQQFGGPRRAELETAVREMEDDQAPMQKRIQARAYLKTFLGQASKQVGGLAVGLLQKYLETRLGLS